MIMNRFKTCISIVLTASLVLACFPLSVQFRSGKLQVQAEKAEAIAPFVGAAAFLAEAAAAVGMTSSQLVATIVGVCTMSTGMGFAVNEGIKYGNSLSDNLGNLAESADYPSWDELTEEQQTAWGTKDEYDSAKFNCLMDAFGLDDARDRFYSSGGANFEWQQDELDRLAQLQSIGNNWINGLGNTIGSLLGALTVDRSEVVNYYFGNTSYQRFDKTEEWPSGSPDYVYVNKGNDYVLIYDSGETNYRYFRCKGSSDVYWIVFRYGSGTTQKQIFAHMFSLSPFAYGNTEQTEVVNGVTVPKEPTLNRSARKYSYQGHNYYMGGFATGNINFSLVSENMAASPDVLTDSWVQSLVPIILFGGSLDIGGTAGIPVVDYPEDITSDENEEVYYPTDGLSPNVSWVTITTAPESGESGSDGTDLTEVLNLLRRFEFYQNGNLKVYDITVNTSVGEVISRLNEFQFDANGNVYVADRNVYSQITALLNAFNGFLQNSLYSNGIVKVHDEGVYDLLTDANTELITISSLLRGIQTTLTNWFGVDTATDVIGEVDFSDLDDKATGLVDTISTLAPFGAMLMLSEMIAILSQTGNVQTPELDFDFNFMPGHEFAVHVDLTWMADLKPVINVFCVIILLLGLYGATVRLVEMEAAA